MTERMRRIEGDLRLERGAAGGSLLVAEAPLRVDGLVRRFGREASIPDDRPLTTVLLGDSHAVFREALAYCINDWPEFVVVGCAGDGQRLVRLAARMRPQLVLMDVRMGLMSGVEAARVIASTDPKARTAMLTASDLGDDVRQALRSGVHGYLSKSETTDWLHGALIGLARGDTVVSPTIAAKVLTEMSLPNAPSAQRRANEARLSLREREVLRLVVEGMSNKEIGAVLHLSEGTVKKHLGIIMTRLNARNRVEVAVIGVRRGIAE